MEIVFYKTRGTPQCNEGVDLAFAKACQEICGRWDEWVSLRIFYLELCLARHEPISIHNAFIQCSSHGLFTAGVIEIRRVYCTGSLELNYLIASKQKGAGSFFSQTNCTIIAHIAQYIFLSLSNTGWFIFPIINSPMENVLTYLPYQAKKRKQTFCDFPLIIFYGSLFFPTLLPQLSTAPLFATFQN